MARNDVTCRGSFGRWKLGSGVEDTWNPESMKIYTSTPKVVTVGGNGIWTKVEDKNDEAWGVIFNFRVLSTL